MQKEAVKEKLKQNKLKYIEKIENKRQIQLFKNYT